MTRQEANIQILAKITKYVMMYPDQRFGQALRNLGVVVDFMVEGEQTPRWNNHFNEEPQSMIKRMETEEKKASLT